MAIMEGPLSKWTNVMKGWQYRWFVLDDNAGLLSYYTSKEKMVRGTRRGCVRLKGAVIGIDDEDDSTFTITVDDKTFHFQARDTEERDKWIHSLEDTILRHTHSQTFQKKWEELHNPTTFQDFDKKLTEADAYLQVLIDQVKDLEARIESCVNDSDKNQLVAIRDKTNDMLETVKHSIILLQIAKNATHPVNGVYQPFKGTLKTEAQVKHSLSPMKGMGNNKCQTGILDKENIDCAIECNEDFMCSDVLKADSGLLTSVSVSGGPEIVPAKTSTASSNRLNLVVPETSYSSSDDDDFFDATEDNISCVQSPNSQRMFEDAVETLDEEQKRILAAQLQQHIVEIDYDALYEDEEEELGSMEGQGSVIRHLLSQLKINMDLTKVVLPTFILERRSLLEMYADFFAHPDIFISIPDFDDPKDRMVQVLRWYLSAFHAGRKSSVAKKPYNPILGEIFRCFWAIPSIKESEKSAEKVRDGPVPWASKNNLTFIAEQVSHHPPVSAFYAEHVNKGISCSAHIWTKSKFLGLSIGVHNIGQGCINVLKYDEEYVITFPNGYGRSILTMPWIELGGDVSVQCSKTGYYADIKFHTKPFYSGKPHRITADVFHPTEKKPFLTVAGEWNGVMQAKWAAGGSEVFVDTRSIPIIKKRVKPLVEQESYESRNLWKDVTTALRLRNVEAATESKFSLEQKQRAEAKERLQNGDHWETRVFHQLGEQWIYDHSLHKRLHEVEPDIEKPI